MEGKPLLQSSEQTERGHRRRLSSILKSTHSPLKDVGSGKEPSQEPTIEKRQRGSRRVSFAETIRVFTPELQSAGSDDKENDGYTTSNSCTDIYKGAADKYGIAGMETLLRGPIQVPGHNSDWNYAKDRTIVFSSDNDMDMTASNTVTIHGLTDEGTQKIDTKQFLASLQSQNSKEVVKNQNFSLSTGGEKHFDAKRNSSVENKIKFSDFLASLGGEKSKASGAYDDNQTVLFTCDQQDMEMTRSHTVSIDNKVLSEISKRQSTNILKELSSTFNKESGNHLENNTMSEYEQNDMDITRSHTTAIENKILEGVKATNSTLDFQNTKRKSILDLTAKAVTSGICLQGEDMDFTKPNSGFFSDEVRRAPSMTLQNNTPLFPLDQDDMDMTYSHTIAIKNTFLHGNAQIRRSVPNVQTTLKCSAADKTVFEDNMELTKSHTMIIDELNQLALPNQSINLQNITSTSSDNLGTELKMCCTVDTDHKVLKQQLHNETVHQEGEMEMTNVNVGVLLADGKSQPWNEGNPVFEALQENTMCLYDQDDMDMTRAHTVAIENKAISELDKGLSKSNAILSTSLVSKSPLRDLNCTSKPHSVIDFNEKRYTNQTLCEPDMDITMLNTFILDSQKPGNVSHPGPKYKILSSVSNQSETRDGDAFNTQSRNQLENSPVSDDTQDKTLFFYDQKDMDITRSHTTAIESKILEGVKTKNVTTEFKNMKRKSVLDFTTTADDMASVVGSGKSFQGEDIDITRSNTVFIDHISDQPYKGTLTSEVFSRRKSVSSRPKTLVPSDEIILPACNMKQTNAIAYLVNKASIDKTICNDGDMEMTRSHTVAIEGKMLEDVKAKIVTADYLNMKRESVLDLTTNAGDLADDLTCRISFQGDDMDITKSNTVFIDQILHNKSADISKRKSVSCLPKSLVPDDEPILQVCNMEENSLNVDRTVRLENKTSTDKTVSNQGDIEMTTRSHTVAMESEILDGAKAKNVTAEIDAKNKSGISFHGEDMDITRSSTVFIDHIPDQKPHISDILSRRKSVSSRPKSLVPSAERKLPVYYMDETFANAQLSEGLVKCPVDKTMCNEDEMEITRSHTLAIESNIMAGMKAEIISAELLDATKKSFIDRTTNGVNVVDKLTSEISFNGEDMDITKSNTVYIDQILENLQNKGIHVSEDLSKRKSLSCAKLLSSDETTLLVCNMEETSANVDVTENLVRKSSVDKTVCNENDMEMTRCHTVAIESKILDSAKAQNVTAGFPNTKRKSVLQADDFTSRISFQCDDMDITKSNTVFIDQISDELYNKGVYTSDSSKRKSVSSRLKSSVPSAERKLPVCIMNETYVNAQLSEGLVNKCPVDKTICNEDEMEITRSHTLAIESNILDGMKAKNVSAELLDDTKKSFLVRTTNAVNMVDDLTSERSFHGEDMDITRSNTVFIDHIPDQKPHFSDVLSRRKSVSSRPKSLVPSVERKLPVCYTDETFANAQLSEVLVNKCPVDKTICNEDEMEMTRSHTLAIESNILDGVKAKNVTTERLDATKKSVLDRTTNAVDMVDDLTSGISFNGEDMDITKSNTVFIDQISEKLLNKGVHVSDGLSKRKSLSCAKLLSSDEKIRLSCNMEETSANVDVTENLVRKSSVVNTECHKGDMEITRCHTVAIESKTLDGTMTENVTAGFRNMKNTSVLDLIGNASDKADDLSSGICFQGEDMDITKSNTVFIDEISDLQNKNASVSRSISNRVSSRPRSLVPADETMLQVCNMEKTHVNAHLPEGLDSKSSDDKTLCNDGDMEMTRSHTVAIKNKSFEAPCISCPSKTRSQVSIAMASCGQASTCDKITTSRPKVASNAESMPPSVSESTSYNDLIVPIGTHDVSMNISVRELSKLQGNNVLAESNKILPLDCNTKFPSDPDMDITESYSTVEVKFLDNNRHIPSSSIGIIKDDGGKACQELRELESTERLEICRRKNARSLSLPVKSGIFLEGLGNGELPQVHTSPVEDVSLLKPGPCNTELDLIFEKSNTVGFIDHQNRPISFRNSLSANVNSKVTPNAVIGVDCKIESLEENCVSNYKSVSDKVKSQLIKAKTENLNASNGLQPVGNPLICESNLITSESKDCLTEQPTACVPQVETYQKDPEVALDIQLKKARSKGKRVSFCFPEMDIVAVDEILECVIKPASQQEIRDAVEHQDRTVHATEEIDFRLIGQASDTENLEDLALHQEHDTSNINVLTKGISSELEVFGNPAELSEESRNQRRSVTNVLSSIKSLTQKPIFSPHHTAPVSSLIDQLPATSQILCPSRSVTDQVFVSSEMANKETIQEKEPTERTKTILMEFCLPSRRSVKMFPPKLPNKRASSTSNLDMDVSSVSEAQPKNEGSKVLFKALNDIEYGQCIGEEMLPDDQEINSIFDYEVPDGAWEELCKKEAIQQNVNVSTSQPKDSMNGQKRGRNTEPDSESQREKRGRLDEDEGQSSTAFKSCDKAYISDYSTPHASKGIEQTCNSTSSQDSRADGMSVELSSQQCSQMDSQVPWNSRCEQSLWQNFQDGSITVQEFFVLLGIRILIQKPRYSELPSKRGMAAELTPSEILLDQFVYQPKLQVYDEECHTLFQAIEELKVSTERQHKPLVQVNSLLWEALRMCSENELMCFGATLKNMKSLYSKKSKLLAHKAKVSTYSKLLRTAQMQKEQLQARLSAADQLLAELAGCISSLHMDPVKHDGECRTENRTAEVQGSIQAEIDSLKSQESMLIRENLELEERKRNLLTRLGSLQEEAQVIGERLQEPSFTEWELVKWTDTEAAFNFLYDSLELSISFGDSIDGENFNNQPCRRISRVTVESQLDDASAPPSTVLVHRLISQYIEKKSAFHEAYKTQNDLPQLLFNLSLVVSRCKLLGEELENLTRWGAIYNVVKVHIQSQEVSLLFSSLATLVKFELIIHLSDTYPTTPLSFTLNNRIGSITKNRVTEIMSKVPIGLWYLKRTVKSLNENLLV